MAVLLLFETNCEMQNILISEIQKLPFSTLDNTIVPPVGTILQC